MTPKIKFIICLLMWLIGGLGSISILAIIGALGIGWYFSDVINAKQ